MSIDTNPFDFFEEIWCINLDRRKDRWNHALEEFSKIGIEHRVQRFSAIENHESHIDGIIKSNVAIIKYAKDKGLKNILIFEDDVEFTADINTISNCVNQLKEINWSLFYFGAYVVHDFGHIRPNLAKIRDAAYTHAVCYNANIYDSVISLFNENSYTDTHENIYDVKLQKLQYDNITVMASPMIALQYESYSDAQNVIDYHKNLCIKMYNQRYIKDFIESEETFSTELIAAGITPQFKTINSEPLHNPFDFFEEIWCINLDSRKDRWEECLIEFDAIGIKDRVKRFSAIENENGPLGCLKSFSTLIKYAKDKGLKNILIFEDDVIFRNAKSVHNTIYKATCQVQETDWELLYFGVWLNTYVFQSSANLLKLKEGLLAHAICYNHTVFDEIIKRTEHITDLNDNNLRDIWDWILCDIQRNDKSYLAVPMTVFQRPSYSNLEKSFKNYGPDMHGSLTKYFERNYYINAIK
ncbi:MAG: glycosyltransferase family 25 protein [Candidatus Pacearchaeota archaeon]|jgi:GR25 family glycosyltransferase involved in LPS biosynthesis|nr:hypothetical protein [Clostridia bacterium]